MEIMIFRVKKHGPKVIPVSPPFGKCETLGRKLEMVIHCNESYSCGIIHVQFF